LLFDGSKKLPFDRLSIYTEFSMLSARVLGAVAVVVSSLSVGSATADTLSLSGIGTPSTLPADFNPTGLAAMNLDGIGVGTAITIFSGINNTGGLSISPTAGVTFTFMGKEAAYTDQLLFGNTVLFNNNVAPGTSSGTFTVNAGSVPFSFRAVTPHGNLDANNGGAIALNLEIAFAKVSDTVFYAFFEDGGGGSIDFDDMVVRITDPPITTTPLPGALPLFATGLGALGLLGWRRKRKNAAAIAA
jgi:hypothetical protein